MQLILWRHAQAEDISSSRGDPRQRDLARELTLKGEKQAKLTAAWLRPRLPPGARVLVSPAIRTVQTAQQLTSELERIEVLAPDNAPLALLEAAGWPVRKGQSMPTDGIVVVVGHQPTLGRVASLLLSGVDRDLSIRKSAAWWFESAGGESPSYPSLRAVFDAALG